MKPCLLLMITCAVVGCSSVSSDNMEEGEVNVSQECAAVLLALGAGAGATILYTLTPAAICTAGFCPTGVASGSFASWWQSTLPLVAKGSAFAKLQALAAGGAGMKSLTIAGGAFGSLVAAGYVRQFCTYVDKVDPNSGVGKAIALAVTAGTTAAKSRKYVETFCASSETCTAATGRAILAAGWVAEKASETKDFVLSSCSDSQECTTAVESATELGAAAVDYVTRSALQSKEQVMKSCSESEDCMTAFESAKEIGANAVKLGSTATKVVSRIINRLYLGLKDGSKGQESVAGDGGK